MRVVVIPCLSDNYAYLVACEETSRAAIVDPSESAPVLAAIEREGVELVAIWNTHHHYDHTGGNNGLLEKFPELAVVAHRSDEGRVHGQTVNADDGDVVRVGETKATILFNPGHTLGAISYHLEDDAVVFTGDTLFGAGCGRMFEGKPAQMHTSLMRLARLPGTTKVYCGHEYAEANLRFAEAVEPSNLSIAARRETVQEARAANKPTVPYSIALDRETNPFLRCDVPEVIESVRSQHGLAASDPTAVFGALRRWKDNF